MTWLGSWTESSFVSSVIATMRTSVLVTSDRSTAPVNRSAVPPPA